ncbi:MAG: sulfite exporter TauE/SafE family protein [Planctomycetota bacterium]
MPPRAAKLRPWFVWLAVFYAGWLGTILAIDGWAMIATHWPIAAAMAAGSYAAGSTPMGGGTVGFPILVLLFDQPARLGRDFAFAVQSIGMVSASIFILSRRTPLAIDMLRGSIAGVLIGVPIGVLWIAPWLPELWVKLIFAVIWGSFGVLHLRRIEEIAGHHGTQSLGPKRDRRLGFAIGLLAGATVVAASGVGVDMVLYTVLILLCRTDLRIAIPTSVVIMAIASVTGVATKLLTTGLQPGVFGNWLAAAPVVALGAPIGAYVVDHIGRKPTLLVVAAICVGQFVWTLVHEHEQLGSAGIAISVLALGLCLLGFEALRALGARRVPGPERE